jgi:dihydroorotate dehydrogenase
MVREVFIVNNYNMIPYGLVKPALFALDPEVAHDKTFAALDTAHALGLTRLMVPRVPDKPVDAMGIRFPNPVGLAAGLDKNAAHIDGLSSFGFGFIEVGTVTPRAQPGNAKPRMFRLTEHEALINRLGFNNGGLDALIANVKKAKYRGILGINIGKNFDTPNERAQDDYVTCLRAVYGHAHYITVNISSPNTKGLRDLQNEDALRALITTLKNEQLVLAEAHGRYVPIAVKIAPDMDDETVRRTAKTLVQCKADAIIATNTTIDRDRVAGHAHAGEIGGLSGAPVREKSDHVLSIVADEVNGKLPIIGVGGVFSAQDAARKLKLGASLVQIYTGLIYRGPQIVGDIVRGL